ncbi:MAG: aminotransferase class I/II-fold pyridoxal phosphate-dependent enzyme [Saprospiraceae bacterium]|nr:aminotransferase class I/II-fold pyridoxal phosphate-dependent enzyme [Saprospiraceae bacterium]
MKKDFNPIENGFGTLSVWAGEDQLFDQGATVPPIALNVTFGYNDLEEWQAVANGTLPGHIYSRNTNPSTRILEEKIRLLDGAEAACSFSTGMAAISNTLSTFLTPGKKVVSQKDTYGGTSVLFLNFLPERGVHVELCDTGDVESMLVEIKKGCDLLYLETPTNPTLKLVDIKQLADAAHQVGAIVVVDNTFATPINQRPLSLGVDLVIYSATKFLCGHADALGGLITGKAELVKRVFSYREINGAALHPFSSYLILRGLRTLELRMLRHNENAQYLAEYLESHPKVDSVFYPGLSSHPQHELAKAQMSGYGGVLSFTPSGDFESVKIVLENLQFARLAAHLGSVDTIAGPPRTTSHVEASPEERRMLGIPENLIRYAVGIENVRDLEKDLDKALRLI